MGHDATSDAYGVGSMDLPDLMQGTSLEGVGQERLGIVL